jgi:hypothetical protein
VFVLEVADGASGVAEGMGPIEDRCHVPAKGLEVHGGVAVEEHALLSGDPIAVAPSGPRTARDVADEIVHPRLDGGSPSMRSGWAVFGRAAPSAGQG